MKKYTVLSLAFVLAISGLAQPDVTSAFNANKSGDYDAAVTYIEKAMGDPKATAKEKTFRYRASIYLNIAKNQALFVKYPEALDIAKESLLKAMEMDERGDFLGENKLALAEVQTLANDFGIEFYNKADYASAAKKFELSNAISERFDIVDTLSIYNIALCHDKSGNVDKAVAGYLKCGEINYNVPNVYLFAAKLEADRGKKEESLAIIKKARVIFPRSKELILEETNYYLQSNNYAEAELNLKTAVELEPTNEILFFALGTTYENLEKPKEAEIAYKRAIEIKPDYFDPLFNLGASYFNKAVEIDKGCDDIPPSQKDKYADCVAKANVEFEKALPYLEKANESNPEDKVTLRSLKDIYYRMERMQDYSRIKGLLGED